MKIRKKTKQEEKNILTGKHYCYFIIKLILIQF